MNNQSMPKSRWLVAIMGTLLQACLGTVYAWSYFQKPLMTAFGWTNSQTAWTFSIAICALGIAAAWGGMRLGRIGPRPLALTGGLLFGVGYLIAALALSLRSLPLLYIGYGLLGGIGLGLGYVTPVATAAKWFPDKKGLVTGMVVMGFGFGALLMSKVIAPFFMSISADNLVRVFIYTGVLMLFLTLPAASFIRNPPDGYQVPLPVKKTAAAAAPPVSPGAAPAAGKPAAASGPAAEPAAGKLLRSRAFIFMWILFFMNITAGIMFIGFQSPMLQDLLLKRNPLLSAAEAALAGATLIAISSVFNGIGRFLWGGISDRIGRIQTFRLILGSQFLVFLLLPFVGRPLLFGVLVCYVLLCYGGGFGTMPSFVLNMFGAKAMPVIYGTILTAWSAAGIAGPQIVAAMKDRVPDQAGLYTFLFGAAFLAVGLAATFLVGKGNPSAAETA
jgi:OFA family oxalate/formate antiporter-like MFS transporter